MNENLVRNVGSVQQDNLIAKLSPPAECFGVMIRKLATAATLKRGTIMAKSSDDNLLVVLGTTAESGETLAPYCILADDVEVGITDDAAAVAYRCGNFNPDAVTVLSGTTLTEANKDELRKLDILFTKMM